LSRSAGLPFAADEAGEAGRTNRFEATFGRRHALDGPSLDRFGQTLDVVVAEIAKLRKLTKQRRVEAAMMIVPGSTSA
jgi:hypothetical protein